MEGFVELIKSLAVIVGFVLSLITLLGICIKPIRKYFINKIIKISNKDYYDNALKRQDEVIKKQGEIICKEESEIKDIKLMLSDISKTLAELSARMFKNEADRLRSELFDCGNRCRRDIPLSGEEFRHIQQIFRKYSEELKCNGIGEEEYNFIKDYFNSPKNQERLNKKYIK